MIKYNERVNDNLVLTGTYIADSLEDYNINKKKKSKHRMVKLRLKTLGLDGDDFFVIVTLPYQNLHMELIPDKVYRIVGELRSLKNKRYTQQDLRFILAHTIELCDNLTLEDTSSEITVSGFTRCKPNLCHLPMLGNIVTFNLETILNRYRTWDIKCICDDRFDFTNLEHNYYTVSGRIIRIGGEISVYADTLKSTTPV